MVENSDELRSLLWKKHLHEKTIIDLLDKFSSKTIDYLIRDLNINNVLKKEENTKSENLSPSNKIKIKNSDSSKLYVFSDGGCINNGRKNAKGGYSIFFTDDHDSPYYKFNFTKKIESDDTNSTSTVTNNQAELRAIRKIFKVISDDIKSGSNLFNNKEIVICTDSMYSINCVTKWIKTWSKNGWVNSKGEIVKNKELIQDIVDLEKKIIKVTNQTTLITFRHIASHQPEVQDKNSLEWVLWYGNKKVDENITKIING